MMIPQFKKLLSQALGKDKPHRYYDLNEEKEEGEENFVPNLGDQEGFVAEQARTDRSRLVTYVLAGILVCSHAAVWWYTRRTYGEWDINDPQSAFLAGIDRSLHMSRDNPFEAYNAFTASPEDFGDWAAERWWDIGAYAPTLIVPEKYGADFGFDKTNHSFVTFEGNPGISHEGFPASFQMMHQLHCIDFIRQGLYFNVQYYRNIGAVAWIGTEGHEDKLQMHLLHCIDVLRQDTLCKADMRLQPFLRSTNGVFGDFRIPRKCKNWAAVRDFAEDPNNGYGEGSDTLPIDQLHTVKMEGVERWPIDRLWRGL